MKASEVIVMKRFYLPVGPASYSMLLKAAVATQGGRNQADLTEMSIDAFHSIAVSRELRLCTHSLQSSQTHADHAICMCLFFKIN